MKEMPLRKKELHRIHMILFDGLPVPSSLLFKHTDRNISKQYNLTHYLQCIHEYDVVNVCVSVQTFQDRYSNLLILLLFEKNY